MDLFDFITPDDPDDVLQLCPHGVTLKAGGWTKDADPDSRYHGTWVHATPSCRKPKHLKELIS